MELLTILAALEKGDYSPLDSYIEQCNKSGIDPKRILADLECVVCNRPVSQVELDKMESELKPYPVHEACLNTFESTKEFLEYAKAEST